MDLSVIKVTEKKLELFNKLHIDSVEKLLQHYPFRYENRQVKPFGEWQKDETVYFEGEIISKVNVIRHGGKKSTMRFRVLYDHNEIELLLFNRFYSYGLLPGKKISVFGKFVGNNQVIVNTYNEKSITEQLGIVPIYHSTEGMRPSDWKKYISRALEVAHLDDLLPVEIKQKYQLLDYMEAIYQIHQPSDEISLQQAIRTIKFNEIFQFQLLLQYNCHEDLTLKPPKNIEHSLIKKLISSLPYQLTNGQQQAIDEVIADLQSEHLMCRLLQGDVGCGKTMVAIISLYANYLANSQSAFLAPTEILANQHFHNVQDLLASLGVKVALLSANVKKEQKEQVLQGLKEGTIDVVVGTHSLLQDNVTFANLGLVVADEQHRFGVEQRKAILDKGEYVDFLSMSATPIPRTLATSIFGDLNISTIKELPKGRQPIFTHVINENSLRTIQKEMLKAIDQGSKIYIVASSIEDSVNQRNVVNLHQNLSQAFPQLSFGLLHGKMKNEEKSNVITDFEQGKYQVLVATSVIEVGVDISDADWIIIYDSDRFGLNQLHQLRGRVGRRDKAGYCYLLTSSQDENTLKRLRSLETCKDGFAIAQQDLQLRGPGDLLGTKQSGSLMFALADLQKDQAMMEVAKEECLNILPKLSHYPKLQQFIDQQNILGQID